MEIKSGNYLIIYCANSFDFRIIIYNNINNKKYETIKTSDDYKIYKDIGLDIFEIIKNCLDNNTFTINDNNDYLISLLSYKELSKISIICDIIQIDKEEICELKNTIYELKNIVNNQNSILENLKKDANRLKNIVNYHNDTLTILKPYHDYELKNIIKYHNDTLENLKKDTDGIKNIVKYHNDTLENLKPYYEVVTINNIKMNKKEAEILELKQDINELKNKNNFYELVSIDYELVSIDNTTFHKDIQEIHINKLTKTYERDYWNAINSYNISLKICMTTNNYTYHSKIINIQYLNNFTNTMQEFTINDIKKNNPIKCHVIKTPQFKIYHKYPEIPKIYFSDTIKIKELTDNLQNLDVIGISYFDISQDDIINLLNLKKLYQIKFYKCNFVDITQAKIRLMFGLKHVIFSV